MAIKANIVIDQGTDYTTDIALTTANNDVFDLTGFTANAYIRKTYTSSTGQAFTTTVNTSTGVVTLTLSSTASSNLVAGRYVYDVLLRNSANVRTRAVEGIVTVTPRVAT
jgi:hypothetical protein